LIYKYVIVIIIFFALGHNVSFSQDLIAHYPLDGNAKDISSNYNNGNLIGGAEVSKDRFGNPCGAVYFNGKDGYIEVPNSKSIQSITKEFSVSSWFYIPKTSQNSVMRDLTLICKGDESSETSSNPQYRVQVLQMQNQSTISINTDFTKNDYNYSNHLIEFDKWNFYALTYDGNYVKTYLNGVETWSQQYSRSFSINNSPLHIGKDMPGGIEYFRGALDDLRVYKGALTPQQIQSLLNDNSGAIFNEEFSMKCPSNYVAYTSKNNCYSKVNYDLPLITPNCGKPILKKVTGLGSGENFPLGSNIVAFNAQGEYKLEITCDFAIIVKDSIPPVVECISDTSLISSNPSGILYTYSFPKATDNCGIEYTRLKDGPNSNSVFKVGATKLTFETQDKSGNKSECSYNVNVIYQNPAITKVINNSDNAGDQKITENNIQSSSKTINDSVHYQHDLKFKTCTITIVIYDDGEEDNDTVSVYFNNEIIVDYEMIYLKSNKPIVKSLTLNPDKTNILVSKAWNMGSVPPNTLKIEFFEGDLSNNLNVLRRKKPLAVKVIHSRPGVAGAVKLQCKMMAR
jgi:hypothetical protein